MFKPVSTGVRSVTNKTLGHPCFHCGASGNARIHLPIAPKCNIQCNYCVRKFDCVNESRPGVTSAVLSPEQAAERYFEAKGKIPNLAVVGIAGPGDALANFDQVKRTLELIREQDEDVTFCLSTNGLMLPHYANQLIALGVTHVTVTMNAATPGTGAKIYRHIEYLDKKYIGEEAASILLQNQLAGIRYLCSRGLVLKVNIVYIKGMNAHEIERIAALAKDSGCVTTNIMQMIPVEGSAFEKLDVAGNAEINQIRKECAQILPQMYHCKQCRSDAVGTLGQDSGLFSSGSQCAPTRPEKAGSVIRFAVCSGGGRTVDLHFGNTGEFYIYEYANGKTVFVETRKADTYCGGPAPDKSEGRVYKLIKSIRDCDCVLCVKIGEHAADILKENQIDVRVSGGTVEEEIRNYAGGNFPAKTRQSLNG